MKPHKTILLASIAAVTCLAHAKPVRGILGSNEEFETAPIIDPTAADYVQEGLVSLWDGIETGGYGITQFGRQGFVWVNCISGERVTLANSFAATDGVGMLQTYGLSFPSDCIYQSQEWTVEYVAVLVPRSYASFLRGESGTYVYYPQLCGCLENDSRAVIRGGGYGYSLYCEALPYSLLGCSFSRGFNSHVGYLYADDNEFAKRNMNMDITAFPNSTIKYADYAYPQSRIKCIRMYNRALSEEEIEFNHAVDMVRFFNGGVQ